MPGEGKWASPPDRARNRIRLSGITVDRSTLKALRWKAVRARKSVGRYLEDLIRPALGLKPLAQEKKEDVG